GMADKIQGETIPVPGARLDYTLREPLGVTAHIAPWNYPLLLASRGIAPALAAGNTVVLKPATLTPLTARRLGELAAASGFPPGVVNVVTGPGRQVGEALANHRDVDSVTFTGSTDTGKQLLRIVADRVVPTTLELGGKNPQIVLADAKLDRAVRNRRTSRPGTSSSPRFSRILPRERASRGRRSSARSWPRGRSPTSMRRSRGRTIRPTGSPRASGRRTSATPTPWRDA